MMLASTADLKVAKKELAMRVSGKDQAAGSEASGGMCGKAVSPAALSESGAAESSVGRA